MDGKERGRVMIIEWTNERNGKGMWEKEGN
jgi:hypothetical protein